MRTTEDRRLTVLFIFVSLAYISGPSVAPARSGEPDPWVKKIAANAPKVPTVRVAEPREILVFSLATGYQHSVIPNVDQVFQVVGQVSGAFRATITRDIEDFAADRLKKFDVLVLNNTCSVGPRRDLLLDVLENDSRFKELSEKQRQKKARTLEKSILEFVRMGKGLVAIHGSPTLLNNSVEFTEMVGAAFDYHPPSQEVTLRTVEPEHPLAAAFRGKGAFVHKDEPYCFKGPYVKKNFRPLLAIETESVKDPKGRFADDVRYTAWIKPYGEGRVFFCSPSHFRESYESPILLSFLLDGIQYAAGDYPCDDSTR